MNETSAFIILIAAVFTNNILLTNFLGIFLPLITVNCAILGTSLFMINRQYTFGQAVGFGLGAGLGWALAIILMAGLQHKMLYSNIPEPFRGVPIAMIITCVLAMAFMGFVGMVSTQ